MKKCLLSLLIVCLFTSVSQAANVRSTFGNKDSTNVYAIEEKSDNVVYFRPTGGVKWAYENKTTSDTLTLQETGTTYTINSSTPATFTLPAAEVGMSYRFVSNTNVVFHVDPNGTDTIKWSVSSQPLAAGDKISSGGATGDSIELFCTVANQWAVATVNGTFTDGN